MAFADTSAVTTLTVEKQSVRPKLNANITRQMDSSFWQVDFNTIAPPIGLVGKYFRQEGPTFYLFVKFFVTGFVK